MVKGSVNLKGAAERVALQHQSHHPWPPSFVACVAAASSPSDNPRSRVASQNGGYAGPVYSKLRTWSQRRLADLIAKSVPAAHVAEVVVGGGGLPKLVPYSRRLEKKLGDLVQLLFVLFDWQPAAARRGHCLAHGFGPYAHFRSDLLLALLAFSQGLVFDVDASAETPEPPSAPPPSADAPPPAADTADAIEPPRLHSQRSSLHGEAQVLEALRPELLRALRTVRALVASLHDYLSWSDGGMLPVDGSAEQQQQSPAEWAAQRAVMERCGEMSARLDVATKRPSYDPVRLAASPPPLLLHLSSSASPPPRLLRLSSSSPPPPLLLPLSSSTSPPPLLLRLSPPLLLPPPRQLRGSSVGPLDRVLLPRPAALTHRFLHRLFHRLPHRLLHRLPHPSVERTSHLSPHASPLTPHPSPLTPHPSPLPAGVRPGDALPRPAPPAAR